MTAQPIRSLDTEVATWLDLTEKIEELTSQRDAVKARLAEHGIGTHTAAGGITVTVGAPPRRFNQARALTMLTEEQKALCTSLDDKLIKAQLPPVLLDQCMDEGTGAPRVTVK